MKKPSNWKDPLKNNRPIISKKPPVKRSMKREYLDINAVMTTPLIKRWARPINGRLSPKE